MAKQTINLGTGELTGDGESIRSAFSKINDNFDELYTQDSSDVVLSAINASLIPDTDVAYDLGSASNRFRDLYLSGSTIDLGGTTLSIVGGQLVIGGASTSFSESTNSGVDSSSKDFPKNSNTESLTDSWTATGGGITGTANITNVSIGISNVTVSFDQSFTATGAITFTGSSAGSTLITNANLADVATSGDYADLINKPTLFDGDLTGSVFADDSTLLVDGVNGKIVGDIDIGATRLREEFIEFQGASQLSIPLDGWRSQFAIDIVNKEVVVTTARTGSGQDVLVVQPGSVIFTTDYYFIDGSTYYQVTGVTDLGGGLTQLDIPGYDFTSLIGPNPIELFDSSTNTDPHEVRIDSGGDATGIRSLTGVTGITGQDDQYLYLLTSLSSGSTSSNIAMTSVGGVKNTLNGTTSFGPEATVNFANATVTNWTDPNVVNTHNGGVWITVGGQEATIDNLTVRIVNDGFNGLDLQFNYDPDATAGISASGDSDNRFSGITSLAPGNTTWTTLNSITTVGTTRTFTVTDHGFHKVYRGTVVSHAMPDGGGAVGDAYCILERLL